MPRASLKKINLPEMGFPPEPRPELSPGIYQSRLAKVRQRMEEQELEALLVYGDREHFANIHYLTNYDPRFEETLLIILPKGRPVLLLGNEGMGYSTIARLDVERVLYQPFSLLGQPRDKVRSLASLLAETGLNPCRRVGTAGWKYFSEAEFADADEVLDLPDYIARSVRSALRPGGRVTNETALFMDPEIGLRNLHEAEQLADFEWVSAHNSQSLLDGIRQLQPGRTELEIFSEVKYIGLPVCCHPVCSSGDLILRHGMASATSRVVELGDPIMMTLSYQGSNCCRFGWVARSPKDLPEAVKDYVAHAAVPYAEALAAWYEALCIGTTGDSLHHAVRDRLLPLGFALELNAGHQIATDEWTHSLVTEGSSQRIRSGMYWQADFFPTLTTAHHGAFAEDGLAIADTSLRAELALQYPLMWQRLETRRTFMKDQLGIEIADDVLPFSNFQAAVLPYFLSPDQCMILDKNS